MSCVVVFGREPLPGAVKTRLAAGVGEEVAALVYRELLGHTLGVARSVGADVVLALAEPPRCGFRPPLEVAVEVQATGDLGRRMACAFERRFSEGYRRVVLIGSDCPRLGTVHLEGALAMLDEAPVALGPAADGGYWLIGLREPVAELFEGIAWSTPGVLAQTRERLHALNLDWRELETLSDLDTGGDLERLLGGSTSSEMVWRLRAVVDSVDTGGGV